MNVETKPTITFGEFQAWLTGLIRGLDGKLPGVGEWKQIKAMMDKVQPEVKEVPVDRYPSYPYVPNTPSIPYPYDNWPNKIWCSDGTIGQGDGEYIIWC